MGPITYTYDEILTLRDGGVPSAALENLCSQAEEIIKKPTYKVTEIKLKRPSGDMHDYMSVSPY